MATHPIPFAAVRIPRPAAPDATALIIHWYALGASLCCAALFVWWVLLQHAHRCDRCGSAPVMCRCPAAGS